MSDASIEVLLEDFENKDNWDLGGSGAGQTHITTFAEGAPSKEPGVYANGAAGADYRAVALLVRSAADGLDIELLPKPGAAFAIPGRLEELNLWVRSPHASIRVFARVGGGAEEQELSLGRIAANGEWQRAGHELPEPVDAVDVLGLRIRLTEVVKRAGEVMILLDDLTARTRR
ncbi:hypothetical protein [Nocardia sp. NPDC005366]|uniref:hypothetical protein n=1 Tax=Nocardia sp. NPDC005366 TaxID=3156878 RepID=UPI0033B95CFD